MSTPILKKSWTISANNRISFVSLNDTMSKYLFGVKEFLKTHGYTVRGSSNGSTASPANTLVSDGVDRWTTAANVTTRGAASANAQSWTVLRDATGVDILLAYQGATDDVARISFSVGQLFTTQATGTFQPTATDEAVMLSALTLINATTSADRVWFGWVDNQSKLCRFAVARSGVFTGQLWGVERLFSIVNLSGLLGVTWVPTTFGFGFSPGAGVLNTGTTMGIARTTGASTVQNAAVTLGVEQLQASNTVFTQTKVELQGGFAYSLFPLSVGSTTSNTRGKLGNLTDWWLGRTSGSADGDMYNEKRLICAGNIAGASSLAWPWDGSTSPVLT